MSSLKISIVTPSFNQSRFIEANILSVLNQNYADFEHIIIDGSSTDGTIDILKKYPHLHWISENDQGQSDALNKGFKMATGDIVGWLNSDDTYCPDIFKIVADQFKDKDVEVLCGDGFEIDDSGTVIRRVCSRSASPEILIKYWIWKYEYIQPAFFFHRNVFDKVGYLNEQLVYTMDYDFFIRLGGEYTFHHLPKPLANYRLHAESKTGRNYKKIIPDYIWEMQKVSYRYWGSALSLKYYGYLFSFIGGIIYSILKNIFFSPTSKSRAAFKHTFLGK